MEYLTFLGHLTCQGRPLPRTQARSAARYTNPARINERPSVTSPKQEESRFKSESSRQRDFCCARFDFSNASPRLKCDRNQSLLDTKNGHLGSLETDLKWKGAKGLAKVLKDETSFTENLYGAAGDLCPVRAS